MEKQILLWTLIAFSIFILALLFRLIKGPGLSDRMVAVNAINTLIIASICLLSRYLEVDYLLDVALIYALLGFMASALLLRILISKKKDGRDKE